ncbi:MAG TPA: S41 family peptidase [Fimbriimonas sp.]|nr:S41 family peptidase [Fimbriimonas sp.]
MNDVLKSVVAAAGVTAACLTIRWGAQLREKVDLGGLQASNSNSMWFGNWLASQSNDVNVPASEYYDQMVSLLKQYYVEPIGNDEKLASGSVRGMVGSLGDVKSLFMDSKEFHAYVNRQKGLYEGIGVSLSLELPPGKKSPQQGLQPQPEDAEEAVAEISRFPKVVVSAVVPGGPADLAGVKAGDSVADIDGHWVVDQALLDKFRHEQSLFNERKITFSEIAPLQRELRQKTERALLPIRAEDKLLLGTSGSVKVVWNRDGVTRTSTIQKGTSRMPGFSDSGGKIVLPMTMDAAQQLKGAIQGKSEVTIDLRNNPTGDYEAMAACLDALVPAGNYGQLANDKGEKPSPVNVSRGNPHPPKITLLVDKTTRGPAEILALALSSHGKATLSGSETGGDRSVRETIELPDGSGYDLVTAVYRPLAPTKSELARSLMASTVGSSTQKDSLYPPSHKATEVPVDSTTASRGGRK